MKPPILFFVCMTAVAVSLKAQQYGQEKDLFNDSYNSNVKLAVEHYDKKDYRAAAEDYARGFALNKGQFKTDDLIKLVGCWAMAGEKDSAFARLKPFTRGRYTKYNAFQLNLDFAPLQSDPRWTVITDSIKVHRTRYNPQLDVVLTETLDTVLQDDQKYRKMEPEIKSKYGKPSKEMAELERSITLHDSINQIKVLSIIDKYGWPSSEKVGGEGSTAMFLVFQHADLKVQEKYLPQVREAAMLKKIPASYLALLNDRIAISKGKKQIYGTQVGTDKNGKYYLEPLDSPEFVDKKRSEVGLGPLSEYLKQWDIVWPEKK